MTVAVRTDPRRRLLEGMTRVAAVHGYAGASVARVTEEAESSRATFYEHFTGREECFLLAYRQCVGRLQSALLPAALGGEPDDRPRVLLAALLDAAAMDPDAARLVLLESLGATTAIREEHERWLAATRRSLERLLQAPGALGAPLQISAASLLGGVLGVICSALLEDRAASLPDRLEDLLAWITAHRLEAGERRRSEGDWEGLGRGLATARVQPPSPRKATLLPRGRQALPGDAAAILRRERILAATTELVAEKGYAEMTVSDVVTAARVPRAAFYAHFESKQEAYVAVQVASLQRSVGAAAQEFTLGATWPDRVWRGLAALFEYLAAHPAEAYLVVAEVHAAGEAAVRRELENRSALTLFLEQGYRRRPAEHPLPPLCSEAIAAAIYAQVRQYVVAGRAAWLPELLPRCAYVCLACFLGPREALRVVELKAREARAGR